MVYQKGLDLILGSPRFLSLDAQFLFLGQGEKKYVEILKELAAASAGTHRRADQLHRERRNTGSWRART